MADKSQIKSGPSYAVAELAGEFGLSADLARRLEVYSATLCDWQERINLVSNSTLADRWERHFRDSAQLFELMPVASKSLVDLGSGAGFPGLVLALMGEARGLQVTLVESTGKKCLFLREAATQMGLSNVTVVQERIENLQSQTSDVVSARALAALPKLLGYASVVGGPRTTFLFPKGQYVDEELTEATKYWHMDVKRLPSRTSPDSTILVISNLKPKPSAPTGGSSNKHRK